MSGTCVVNHCARKSLFRVIRIIADGLSTSKYASSYEISTENENHADYTALRIGRYILVITTMTTNEAVGTPFKGKHKLNLATKVLRHIVVYLLLLYVRTRNSIGILFEISVTERRR